MLNTVLLYTLLPVIAIIAGGVVAAYRPPGARLRSSVQHFAAGIVFAAVALELLPDIMHEGSPLAAVIGFALGIGLMLTVKTLAGKLGGQAVAAAAKDSIETAPAPVEIAAAQPTPLNPQPTSLLITLAIDIAIDGLLIGIGFAAGAKQGVLLTIALTIEVLFLGLSGAAALTQAGASRARVITTAAGLAVLLTLGSVIGVALAGAVSGAALELVLSFGAAALLYLVTEELLVEAHEEPETPLLTAMFFVGFVVLLVIEMLA